MMYSTEHVGLRMLYSACVITIPICKARTSQVETRQRRAGHPQDPANGLEPFRMNIVVCSIYTTTMLKGGVRN